MNLRQCTLWCQTLWRWNAGTSSMLSEPNLMISSKFVKVLGIIQINPGGSTNSAGRTVQKWLQCPKNFSIFKFWKKSIFKIFFTSWNLIMSARSKRTNELSLLKCSRHTRYYYYCLCMLLQIKCLHTYCSLWFLSNII